MRLSDLLQAQTNPRKAGRGWLSVCPCHDDSKSSLSFSIVEPAKAVFNCFAGCDNADIIRSLGLEFPDLFDVEIDLDNVPISSNEGAKPPTAVMIDALTRYCDEAAAAFSGSPAETYVERFGITPEQAKMIGLGYDDGSLKCTYLSDHQFSVERLIVPFPGYDGKIRCLQGRSINNDIDVDRKGWMSPSTVQGGFRWSSIGLFTHETEQADLLICEGPGDGLTSYAAGTDVLFIRGAKLANNPEAIAVVEAVTPGRRVFLAGDVDPSGQQFNADLAAHLIPRGVECYLLPIPKLGNKSDLTDWRNASDDWPAEFNAAKRATAPLTEAPKLFEVPEATAESVANHPWLHAHRTDWENGQLLSQHIGAEWSHCPGLGWLEYRDGAHRPDELNQVLGKAAAMFQDMRAIGGKAMDEGMEIGGNEGDELQELGANLYRWANGSLNKGKLNAAVEAAEVQTAVSFDTLDQHDHLLVARNGVIDLRTKELLPHEPGLWMTAGLDFDYHSDAECPLWEKFVLEIMDGRPELVEFLQTFLGYSVTGSVAEQRLGIFVGGGANGKTALLNTIRFVFDPICAVASFAAFEKRTSTGTSDLAALARARVVLASEGERMAPIAEAVLKRVTGGDPVTAAFKYKAEFTYIPKYQLILSSNYRPNVGGNDLGLWRRILYTPFDATFMGENRDLHIEEKLRAEAEGILRWVVTGSDRWFKEGLKIPDVVTAEIDDYREASDPLAGFVGETVIGQADRSPEDIVAFEDIYTAYEDFCAIQRLKAMSPKALSQALQERLPEIERARTGKVRGFRYLELDPTAVTV
jgi:putative DNA primase/helicase